MIMRANPPLIINADFPPKMQFLFEPHRWKVLYGGRGAGRSWGVARYLLIEGIQSVQRNLCVREFQHSIRDSVHKLLADQIDLMQMNYLWVVEQASIRCIGGPGSGTEFSFEGIRHNVSKIKSYEGVTRCWVEEAALLSRNSWDVLIPTIRVNGSQIIVTFNPELESDETYQRLVVSPPSDSVVVKTTWRDNPWFPEVLRTEMDDLRARDYDAYLHVWEGECRQVLDGAVYADELREATLQGRLAKSVPYDRALGIDVYFDCGRSDHTSIWFKQYVGWEHHFVDFYQARQKHIDHYLQIMQARGYTYGTVWLPHDAKAKMLGSKMSIEEQVRAKGYNVRIVPRLSVVDGLNAARTIWPNCWFDPQRCAEGIQALRRYSYAVDAVTQQRSEKPLHDEFSDAADAFRYAAVAAKFGGKAKVLELGKGRRTIGQMLSPAEWFGSGSAGVNSGDASSGWMGQ